MRKVMEQEAAEKLGYQIRRPGSTSDDTIKKKQKTLDNVPFDDYSLHKFKCKFCKVSYPNKKLFDAHRKTQEHKKEEKVGVAMRQNERYLNALEAAQEESKKLEAAQL